MPEAIIIGGGFYGAYLALNLATSGQNVLLIEKEAQLLRRASYSNQARIHQGYHYPRALLTARRSHVNYAKFSADYADCVETTVPSYYAIARQGSKVTAQQFQLFCQRIAAPLRPAPAAVRKLFNSNLIEDVWEVSEAVFNAGRLAEKLTRALKAANVQVVLDAEVHSVTEGPEGLFVRGKSGSQALEWSASRVFLCAYAGTNTILERSQLPLVSLKQEVAEMALVELPEPLRQIAVTLMCGPFFSFLPFPTRPGLHTLSHVRYTPHGAYLEGPGRSAARHFRPPWPATNFPSMRKDAERYVPLLSQARYRDSLWEIKAVLPASETDDSRPILYLRDHGLKGLTCILGGKIDNVYDMIHEASLG